MLVHSSGSPEVPVNVRGALEAAHDAINAFFLLFNIFASEAKVWWVFNHRAFLEALCIGNILREEESKGNGEDLINKDPLFARGKADICKYCPSVSPSSLIYGYPVPLLFGLSFSERVIWA